MKKAGSPVANSSHSSSASRFAGPEASRTPACPERAARLAGDAPALHRPRVRRSPSFTTPFGPHERKGLYLQLLKPT